VNHTGVYRIHDGKLELLDSTVEAPNGIAFSPDEKVLYVNDIRAKKVLRYDVKADGTVENRKIFIDMNPDQRPGLPDGMTGRYAGAMFGDSRPGRHSERSLSCRNASSSRHDSDEPARLSQSLLGYDDGRKRPAPPLYDPAAPMVTAASRRSKKAQGFAAVTSLQSGTPADGRSISRRTAISAC
jgi:hypothetical protein